MAATQGKGSSLPCIFTIISHIPVLRKDPDEGSVEMRAAHTYVARTPGFPCPQPISFHLSKSLTKQE